MCTRTLKILNPKKDLTYRDKIWLHVPCGKCEECRKRYRNDWFVRMYFEYLHCKKENGTTIYVTLTYNNTHLPLFGEVPVFDRDDIQRYLKRLRKAVKSYLGKDCVRYIITSEYGGETKRPHYHGLIFFYYPNLTPFQIGVLKHLLTKSWLAYGGFVHFGRKGSWKIRGVVENASALSYVAKYVGKDMSFEVPKNSDGEDMIPREVQPFHLQSQHLGEYMIEHFGLDKNSLYSFRMLVDGTFVIGEISQYTYGIPQYITRKVLYDYKYSLHQQWIELGSAPYLVKVKMPEVSYTLNEYGCMIKKEQELHSLEFRINELNKIFSNVQKFIENDFGVDEVNELLGKCSCTINDANPQNLIDLVENNWLSWSDNEKVAMVCYVSIFKDRVFVPNAQFALSGACTCLNDAMLYLDEIYSLDVPTLENREFESSHYGERLKHYKEMISHSLYATSLHEERYYIYEDLLRLFNAVVVILGRREEQKQLEVQKKYNNAKLGVAYVV